MANRTVPAATEGMSKPDFSDLEHAANEAQQFAELADYVATAILGEAAEGACSSSIEIMSWERDLIMFATMQAKLASERSTSAFYFACNAAKAEAGL